MTDAVITHIRAPHLLDTLRTQPWAMLEDASASLVSSIQASTQGQRIAVEDVLRVAGAAGPGASRGTQLRQTVGRVAVVPVHYPLLPASWGLSRYGIPTADDVATMVSEAVADDGIDAVVLDFDSPGGVTTGIPEAAERIRTAAATKPVIAVASDRMASAAYWIGAAASEVVASPTAMVGSVGVYIMHVDMSRYIQNTGFDVSIIRAGRLKADTSPYAPLSSEAQARLQRMVDETHELFLGAVAMYRRTTTEAVRTTYGEGSVLTPSAALSAGMIDRVATVSQTIARYTPASGAGKRRGTARAGASSEELFTTGGDEGTPVASESSLEPAPVAEELVVSVNTQAPPAGGAPATVQDERKNALHALAERYPQVVDTKLMIKWDREQTSAADAALEVADLLSTRSAASAPVSSAHTRISGVHERKIDQPWQSSEEFYNAVVSAALTKDEDIRLRASIDGVSQRDPASAGYLVTGQVRDNFLASWWGTPTDLVGMCPKVDVPVGFDSLTFNLGRDDDRSGGFVMGGARAYWIDEAEEMTKMSGKFRQVTVRPHELACLVYMTDKIMRNAPQIVQWSDLWAGAAMSQASNLALVGGNGVGKPSGINVAKCRVVVPKRAGQAANTFTYQNVSDMWAAMPALSRSRAVWLHNIDVEPQIDEFTLVRNVAGTEIVGGVAPRVGDSEAQTLKGRPRIACDYSETLGTEGDVTLFDPQSVLVGLRAGGQTRRDISVHVKYLENQSAIRWLTEIDAQPMLDQPLTPLKGKAGAKLSPIVTLQTRA